MEDFIGNFVKYVATEHPILLWIVVIACCFGYLYYSLYKQYLRDWSSPSVRAKFKKDMKRQLKRLAIALLIVGTVCLIVIYNNS